RRVWHTVVRPVCGDPAVDLPQLRRGHLYLVPDGRIGTAAGVAVLHRGSGGTHRHRPGPSPVAERDRAAVLPGTDGVAGRRGGLAAGLSGDDPLGHRWPGAVRRLLRTR